MIPVSAVSQVPSGEWAGFDPPVSVVNQPPQPTQVVLAAPPPMSIVLPFIEREIPRVLRRMEWMVKLSGRLNRTVFLLPFKGVDASEVVTAAGRAFNAVEIIRDAEGVSSDWHLDEKIRDAAGPNSFFRQAAWFFYIKRDLGPWFFLEPDCVPLTKDWDTDLETAYRASGKPFFGVSMKFQNGDEYLNGAAIYPQNAVALAPSLATRTTWTQHPEMEIGFDVAGGREVLSKAKVTDLIHLAYRVGEPVEPRSGAVLFHGDRTGELVEKLLSGGSKAKQHRVPNTALGPTTQPVSPAQKSSKRKKRGFASGDGATTVSIPASVAIGDDFRAVEIPTIGDEIRYHVGSLVRLATNANRKTRIQAELRKRKLIPRR